ncbi:hypothetical protein FIBSPDRAFT_866203 [Athelia psychrophila]|uniref:Uncharacterized protein n=1 Tax=Athelia psychrophila TaxID=1759441 RepID=A0A166EWC0_9AGAM|nr:hypothetical protein FIBSPDRAFT_866203 [Fibularhizoctonia sp. CBS 109695]
MSIRPHAIWFSEVPELSDSSVDHFPTLGVVPFAKKVQLVLVNSRYAPLPVHVNFRTDHSRRQPTTYYAGPVSTIDSQLNSG